MPAASELIAHGRSAQEINQLIGADGLIYQELDDLVDAVRELNPDLRSFEDSVFSACYITTEKLMMRISRHWLSVTTEPSREQSPNLRMHV